jgi:hypothetical protein
MENTPHIMIAGEGAVKLAKVFGLYIEKVDLHPDARAEWEKRLKASVSVSPEAGSIDFWLKTAAEGHYNQDTIGCVAIDDDKNIVAGCSTSGYAFKLVGRVGDSRARRRIENISFVTLDEEGCFGAGTTRESFEFAVMTETLPNPSLFRVRNEKGCLSFEGST